MFGLILLEEIWVVSGSGSFGVLFCTEFALHFDDVSLAGTSLWFI